MKTKLIALTLAASLSAFAGPEQWLQSGLIHPDIIQQIKPELQLTADQESQMTRIVTEARSKAEPVEEALKTRQQDLQDMLRKSDTTADAASAQLAKVLEAEASIKHLQLRTLIALRDVLTPEQQKKAQALSAPKVAARSDLEARVTAKANRLKTAVDALGEHPTEAMKSRGAEIEALMKHGDLKAADAALDKLITDSGIDEPEEKSATPDFSQFDPGDTNLDALQSRFDAVKNGAQTIISVPLMRQFLKAKEAFESAKAAQDAIAVGRVLTWAEKKLAEK